MSKMKKNEGIWAERAAKVFCLCMAGLLFWFILRYAFSVVAVLLISVSVSYAVLTLAEKISKRTGIMVGLCAFFILALSFVVILGAIMFFGVRVAREGEKMLLWLSSEENARKVSEAALRVFLRLRRTLSFIGNDSTLWGYLKDAVTSGMRELITLLLRWAGGWIGRLVGAAPTLIASVALCLMCCFYLVFDRKRIEKIVASHVSQKVFDTAKRTVRRVLRSLVGMARAYLAIYALTFFESLAGLLLLGAPLPFLLAAFIATVDILPVLGAGLVLIPWGVMSMLFGNMGFGTGILILYGIITLVRQIAEPKIVGDNLGIHPLISIVLMLFGVSLFGISGALAAPVCAVVIREIFFNKSLD